jgi:ADP-ribosyl-[dinitrogen reductase] hydrolase
MINNKDKALGSFIGLAVGDALGAPVEFKEPGEFEPVTDYRTGGVWRLPLGYWTDDTSMAICLAKSILDTDTIDHVNLLEYFSRWWLKGENSSTGRCFDIGNTTKNAIHKFNNDNRNNTVKVYTPAPDRHDLSGNGSIMRLAPVAIRWHNDKELLIKNSIEQSLTTHGSKECQQCCAELGTLIARAINGEDIKSELTAFASVQNKVPNSGRALDTMIAAKWAVGSTSNFNDAVLAAVNLGGDADTIAAVAGQIAGAVYGLDSIKKEWVNQLYMVDDLKTLAEKLYNRA